MNILSKFQLPSFSGFGLAVSFSAVDIIISKEEEIFGPKILMMETTISFLSEGLAVWRLSRNQF